MKESGRDDRRRKRKLKLMMMVGGGFGVVFFLSGNDRILGKYILEAGKVIKENNWELEEEGS